jgi:hypothetical protein
MKTLKTIAAAAALITVAAVAWAQMNHGSHGGGMMMSMDQMQSMMESMTPAEGDSESTKAFKQADMDMMQDMAVEYCRKGSSKRFVARNEFSIELEYVHPVFPAAPTPNRIGICYTGLYGYGRTICLG